MNCLFHFRLPRASWWAGLALAAVLPARAEVTCAYQNPAVPATTPTADFIIHGDGTATHVPTGLVWMRCSLGQTWTGTTCIGSATKYTWQDALQAAQTFTYYPYYADWRLPNKKELASIIEERCWGPAINAAVFDETSWDTFWSSSPDAFYSSDGLGYSVDAWIVDFRDGRVSLSGKSYGHRVRLVRAGP